MRAIGILGGTFDPVHNGHLRVAVEMRDLLSLSEVRLVPVGLPAHRELPVADAEQRQCMLQAALAGVPGILVDDRELRRDGPSYTVDTLRTLRRDLPGVALCLIVGTDQFHALDSWHDWRAIVELAHICVAQRPGATMPRSGDVARLLLDRQVSDVGRLREASGGFIFLGSVPVLDISSTRIRGLIARGQDPSFLLPQAVLEIIHTEHLYDEYR